MSCEASEQPDPRLLFLEALLENHATVAGDVVEISPRTWAIHGSIAVDGEVILAEFDTQAQARAVLNGLAAAEHRTAL